MFVDGYACVVPSVKIVPKQHDHFGGAVSRLPNVGNSTTSVEQWRPVEFDTRLRSCLGSTNSTAGPFQSSPIISTEPLRQLERRRISRSITQTSADPLSPLRRTRDAWPISNGTGFRAQPEARRSPQVRRATPSGHCASNTAGIARCS